MKTNLPIRSSCLWPCLALALVCCTTPQEAPEAAADKKLLYSLSRGASSLVNGDQDELAKATYLEAWTACYLRPRNEESDLNDLGIEVKTITQHRGSDHRFVALEVWEESPGIRECTVDVDESMTEELAPYEYLNDADQNPGDLSRESTSVLIEYRCNSGDQADVLVNLNAMGRVDASNLACSQSRPDLLIPPPEGLMLPILGKGFSR
jgi:hypothetical protein